MKTEGETQGESETKKPSRFDFFKRFGRSNKKD
jgi:hypothetical protein